MTMTTSPSPKTRHWTLDTDALDQADEVHVLCPHRTVKHVLRTVAIHIEGYHEDHCNEDLSLFFRGELHQYRTRMWEMKSGVEIPWQQRTREGKAEYRESLSVDLNYARSTALLADLASYFAAGRTDPFDHHVKYARYWRETADMLRAWRDADTLRRASVTAGLDVLRRAVVAAATTLGEDVPSDAGPETLAARLRTGVEHVRNLRPRAWLEAKIEQLRNRLQALGDSEEALGPYKDPLVLALLRRLCPEVFQGVEVDGVALDLTSDDLTGHMDTILTAHGTTPEEIRRVSVLKQLLALQMLLDEAQ